jgi:transmembrane sensor
MSQYNKLTTQFAIYTANIKHFINKIVKPVDTDKNIQKALISSHQTHVKEQANLLISKISRGLSLDEELDFHLWSKKSDFHRNTLFSLAALSNDVIILNELSTLFPLEKTLPKKNKLLSRYVIATIITLFLLFMGKLFISMAPFPDENNEKQFIEVRTLQTAIGQQTRFSLSDGSRIKLNTNSLVKVSFSKKSRLLTLIKGEANFNVTKDKSRPFTVTVGEKSFTALGTIFNVQKTSNKSIELVVTEGHVLMTTSNEPLNEITDSLSTLPLNELSSLLVAPGEMTTIENNILTSNQKISFEKIQRELSWQQGMLVFSGESLNEALTEISRYTTTTFEINDVELSKIKVAGYFKANDIDGLLKSLSSNFNIQFEKVNNNSIRLSVSTSI